MKAVFPGYAIEFSQKMSVKLFYHAISSEWASGTATSNEFACLTLLYLAYTLSYHLHFLIFCTKLEMVREIYVTYTLGIALLFEAIQF